ncbi:MAG: hypothetical protein R2939_01240 [Kofleriaceae bacterium]
MAYRDDLEALRARERSLVASVLDSGAALDEVRTLIAQTEARARLPVLDNIRVAAPCDVAWESMAPVGDGVRVRHCGSCDKHVYHLSEMTRPEAERLIQATGEELCVRYYQRADGTILTADCAVGVGRQRRRRRRAAAIGASALACAATAAVNLVGPSPAIRAASLERPVAMAPGVSTHMGGLKVSDDLAPMPAPSPAVEPRPMPRYGQKGIDDGERVVTHQGGMSRQDLDMLAPPARRDVGSPPPFKARRARR